ncbi:transposase, partial [Aneurinibacillus tyrosinisolvens]
MAKKGQNFKTYTPEFKAEVVRLYEEEERLGYIAVAKRLGIPSNTQVEQ